MHPLLDIAPPGAELELEVSSVAIVWKDEMRLSVYIGYFLFIPFVPLVVAGIKSSIEFVIFPGKV